MALTPKNASDSLIERLFDNEIKPAEALAAAFNRLDGILHKAPEPEVETYLDCNGKRCTRPKGEGERMRIENRQREYDRRQRHLEHVRREVEALRLDEIDPDWRDHYPTQESAAAFYWKEIGEYTDWGGGKPKRVLGRLK